MKRITSLFFIILNKNDKHWQIIVGKKTLQYVLELKKDQFRHGNSNSTLCQAASQHPSADYFPPTAEFYFSNNFFHSPWKPILKAHPLPHCAYFSSFSAFSPAFLLCSARSDSRSRFFPVLSRKTVSARRDSSGGIEWSIVKQ